MKAVWNYRIKAKCLNSFSLCVIQRENAHFPVFVNNKFFCENFVGFFI